VESSVLPETPQFLPMDTLIIKLGATGDVVRTTPLLRVLPGHVSWITDAKNSVLIEELGEHIRCVAWEHRTLVADRRYDLVINLEDSLNAARFVDTLQFERIFGAFANPEHKLQYSEDSREWFDLSLISRHGKAEADALKFRNRRTYQDLLFGGLNLSFAGETYVMPDSPSTDLAGDVAIACDSGPVWPMKKWAYFGPLKHELESLHLVVNFLPTRATLLEHLSDVRNHRLLVSGDSLPMHFALGAGIRCVSLFTCTSPWEIHDYGLQTKVVSSLLAQFFYRRDFDVRATTAISLSSVLEAVSCQLSATSLRV
jgi:ADP-heptose:LPS heptosyltransferase